MTQPWNRRQAFKSKIDFGILRFMMHPVMAANMSKSPANPFTREQCRQGMRHAIFSTCWGTVAQVVVRDSSIMILFATLIGAGEMISIATTALQDMAQAFLTLPFAYLTALAGKRRMLIRATAVGLAALLMSAAAPWFGAYAGLALLGTLAIFGVSISAYGAAWFPLLNDVVPPEERGLFFGRLRFWWQLVAAIFILASGALVGAHARPGVLQIVIIIAALGQLGRAWNIRRIPELPTPPPPPWRDVLADILANQRMTGFAIYLFFLYLSAAATVPVAFTFAKRALALPDNLVVFCSACLMAGLIVGYRVGGRIVYRQGVKRVFLSAHLAFALINFLMLLVRGGNYTASALLIALVTLYGFFTACASIAVSSEIFALAPANNQIMSIGFCVSFYAAGIGFSRILASLIIGSGALAPHWHLGGIALTKYHTLFIMYGAGVLLAMALLTMVPAMLKHVHRLP